MKPEPKPAPSSEAVVVECEFDARPETVWRALTVPAIVAEWLWPNTLVAEVGEGFTLQREPREGGAIQCEVVEAEPHRRLAYTWRSDEPGLRNAPAETLVTFELTGTDAGGTHLRVVHRVPVALMAAIPRRSLPPRALAALRPDTKHRRTVRSPVMGRLVCGLALRRAA
jgi:uncharacterized protein YndB with AHSA1/START domain